MFALLVLRQAAAHLKIKMTFTYIDTIGHENVQIRFSHYRFPSLESGIMLCLDLEI